ncbi:MAG: IS1595 family transposase [Candidatus Levyibacteriota bacterium]
MILKEFLEQYSTSEACLDKIKSVRFGFKPFCNGCDRRRSFRKIKGRPVYQCGAGHQISPLVDTVFEKSTTPLQYWFYAMWLVGATRGGISAKQLQRELGVTYKTAWRMMKQIRILMGKDKDEKLDGIVEVDESYFGGKGMNRAYEWEQCKRSKDIVMGMVQRSGKAYMKHIAHANKETLVKEVKEHVSAKAHVMTDEHPGYKSLYQEGYSNHHTVNHVAKEYVRKRLFHTNSVEGLWGRIKPGVKGVYRKVSGKYIESYMDEYCFRYNNRKSPDQVFDLLLARI